MRAVIQRVSEASVEVNDEVSGEIGHGLVVFIGVEDGDETEDIQWLAGKIADMRIFDDEEGQMNHSVKDVNGEVLLVSQFTLHASTKKGNRPSFMRAAKPDVAVPVYEKFIQYMKLKLGKEVPTGEFGEHMKVSLVNDGPVTITVDTKNRE